jgi:hypothetical protein
MKIKVHNPSDVERKAWVDIPTQYDANMPKRWEFADGRPGIIVKGEDIGDQTTMLHAYVKLGPKETFDLQIVPVATPDIQPLPFQMSSWIGDDQGVKDYFPKILIKRPGQPGALSDLEAPVFSQVEDNEARKVFHLNGRVPESMLVFDGYYYVYNGQDAIRFEGTFTNSDPRKSDIDEHIQHIGFVLREFFAMEHREHFGCYYPWRSPDGNYHIVVAAGDRVLADRQQIPFYGWVLAGPADQNNVDLHSVETRERLSWLSAYSARFWGDGYDHDGGEPVGIGEYTDWGPFYRLPLAPQDRGHGRLARYFAEVTEGRRDLYDQRPMGLAKAAGQTGSQQDFGASKGNEIVVARLPEGIAMLRYNATDYFRPFHSKQVNGQPISKESNPQLWTWSQLPIGTTEPGPADDLGKGFLGVWPPWRTGTGYTGQDDQHRSQNTFHAAYALTGLHSLKAVLFDFLQTDRTLVPGRVGAPRAIGRLFGAWAGELRVAPKAWHPWVFEVMRSKLGTVDRNWTGKQVSADRPIRVLGTMTDTRTLTDADGNAVTAWVVWEHAIAAMGLYAAARAVEKAVVSPLVISPEKKSELRDTLFQHAIRTATLVARYGNFYDGTAWRCCAAVRYNEGELEGEPVTYAIDSRDVSIADMFWTWVWPACVIARRHAPDTELSERIDAIGRQLETQNPRNWDTAEWWAV